MSEMHQLAKSGDYWNILCQYNVCYDFIFADPPFNIGQNYNSHNDKQPKEQYIAWLHDTVLKLYTFLKPGAALVLHGSVEVSRYFIMSAVTNNYDIETEICWSYNFGQCNFNNFIETHTRAIVIRKPGERKFYIDQVLQPSKRLLMGDKRVATSKYKGMVPFGTVWGLEQSDGIILEPTEGEANWGRVQGNNSERRKFSPNQLPEKYITRLLSAYTKEGDLVFDPFAGSGTTAICCAKTNRNCLTTDISSTNVLEINEILCNMKNSK